MIRTGILILASVLLTCSSMATASSSDIDQLTTYSVILGRAVACGADITVQSRSVGVWIDRKFPPGSSDRKTYLMMFMEGLRYHAEQQKQGKSPDTCPAVLRSFKSFDWPHIEAPAGVK